ncbi:hypothetical protein [Alistipes putredinis]|nr:hypothetical protein [Alistipes putredinis]
MKKLLIYIFLSSLVGCNEPEEWIGNGSGYSKYLVQNYVDGSYVLYGMLAEKPSTLYSMSGFQVLLEDPVYYQTPEQEGAQHTDDFLRIAERNHDTEYNNLKSLPWSDLTAFADNFTGIKVTSDKDWSAEYPAGTSLNDKMGVRYVSYAEYIENDYHSYSDLGKEILFLYNKPLSALQPGDLRVIEYTPSSAFVSIDSFILYFTSVPDNPGEEHTFTVEFTTSDGMVKTASVTCTPRVDPTLLQPNEP